MAEAKKPATLKTIKVVMSCNWFDDKKYYKGETYLVTPAERARMAKLNVIVQKKGRK